jgi:YegS/Rv2252/BmrU family lipid kinase
MVCSPVASNPQPFVLLANPQAGGGRAREQLGALQRALQEAGAQYERVLTRGPGDATTLARQAAERGVPGIAVFGGDGTFNEVVNGLLDEGGSPLAPGPWLGILPAGTGGDLRRSVGVRGGLGAAVTRMLWTEPRPVDVGWLRFRSPEGKRIGRAFVNVVSFGLGGEVDRFVRHRPTWMGGRAAYLIGTLQARARSSHRRLRLTLDDDAPREVDALNVAVANGQFFGGGMHIAPKAELDDGRFDVVTLGRCGLVEQAQLLARLYEGRILEHGAVRCERAARITAEPADWNGPVLLDVDGETPGYLPATVELLPGVLRLRG